jgi:hypothetical protein
MLDYDVNKASNIYGGQNIGDMGMQMMTDPGQTAQGKRMLEQTQTSAFDQAGYAGQQMQQAGARGGGPGAAGKQQAMAMMSTAGENALNAYNQGLEGISNQGMGLMGMAQATRLANQAAENRMREGKATGVASQYSQNVANKGAVASSQMSMTSGLLGQAAGAFLGSDIRVKENIEYLNTSPDGHKVYSFNYKGSDNNRYKGVMAQDVLGIDRDAVKSIDGILHVDYSRLDVDMEVL